MINKLEKKIEQTNYCILYTETISVNPSNGKREIICFNDSSITKK